MGASSSGDDTVGSETATTATTVTTATTATTETGTATGTGDESTGEAVTNCGEAPRATVGATLVDFVSDAPIAGATLTSDSCPGVVAVTDDQGRASVEVAIGVPYFPKVVADGFLPTRTGEQVILADFEGGARLAPNEIASLLPHWSEDSPTLFAFVVTDPSEGPECDDLTGYTFAVTDHPEAIITYYSGTTTPMPDESLTATGPLGLAEFAGLDATADGALIELSVSKPGCEVSFDSYPHTGSYVLENGVLSLAAAFCPPLLPPA